MGFAGNLSTLSLVEVFQTINRIRATGTLRLAAAEAGRDVVFADGEIIGVAFRGGEEKQALLRRLILEGKVDAQSAAAISSSGKDSYAILEALISRGMMSEAGAQEAIQRQAEDELYNLSTWDYADFVFQDASPDDAATRQLVDHYRSHPLKLNINSLLMESARRLDEWARLRQVIKNSEAVLGPADGRDGELKQAASEYPGSAVAPLIDAVRTVEDLVRDSVATRLDVYSVLAEMMQQGLIAVLSRDDLVAHADYLSGQQDFIRAARLLRRALSEQPADHAVKEKLADCLEQLGESPEAAGCFGQLALGHLGESRTEEAISSARRAVRLASADPQQRLVLVRCLLAADNKADAIGELRQVASRYLDLGQFEDARSTCLKILELDPKDEQARREMARIFAQAEKDPESEDVVVCVQCGHVNHREAATCSGCEASLRLTCQGCNRIVAVSDRMCIFCGANPHVAGSQRRLPASPATTRIVSKSRQPAAADGRNQGSAFWKSRLEQAFKVARGLEEAGDLSGALREWREVAKLTPDNAELQAHVRELESRSNDRFTEEMIERGHQLRRGRRFWLALRTYRAALRAMPENDPRAGRLREIVASTARHHQRIAVIYGSALIVIGIFAWLVSRPYLILYSFRGELAVVTQQVQTAEQGDPGIVLTGLDGVAQAMMMLQQSSQRLGKGASAQQALGDYKELEGRHQVLRTKLANALLTQVQSAIERGDLTSADTQLKSGKVALGADLPAQRLTQIEGRLADAHKLKADIDARQQKAPELFAEAGEYETLGNLSDALSRFRLLAGINHPEVTPKAKAAVERLSQREAEFKQAFIQANGLVASDLARADVACAALAAQAKTWGRSDELTARRSEIAERIRSAAVAYQELGPMPAEPALEQFIAAHAAAPQAGQARARLDQLRQVQRVRGDQVVAYRKAVAEKRYEQAWQLARGIFAAGQPPADVTMPLVVESMPSGATVTLADAARGTTPCVLMLAPAEAKAEIALSAPGWTTLKRPVSEAVGDWRWQASLQKLPLWRSELGKPVSMIDIQADAGMLSMSGESLVLLDRQGKMQWRTALGAGDELSDNSRFRLAHLPMPLGERGWALGLPDRGMALVDPRGAIARIETNSQVRGRPALYVNDLLGGSQRLAVAAEALIARDLGGEASSRLPLPSPALSGPVVVAKGPDRILVVATVQGQLLGFEESSKRRVWNLDLKAAEIGQLLPVGGDLVVAVLDGSRLACWQLTATGATPRWSVSLKAPAVGEPVLADGVVHLAAGAQVVRVSVDGAERQPLVLPAPSVTGVAVGGGLVAIGCKTGALAVFRKDVPLWMTMCEAMPSSVACGDGAVVVGHVNGTVAAYAP